VVIAWLVFGFMVEGGARRSRAFTDFGIRGRTWLIGARPSEARLAYVEIA